MIENEVASLKKWVRILVLLQVLSFILMVLVKLDSYWLCTSYKKIMGQYTAGIQNYQATLQQYNESVKQYQQQMSRQKK
jgi:hypothetical protein